jgi:hypothetical protein
VTLAGVVLDDKGSPVPGAEIAWSSSRPSLAAVDSATGRVRAHGAGTVLIIARSGGATSMSELTVVPTDSTPDPAAYAPHPPELAPEQAVEESAIEPAPSPESPPAPVADTGSRIVRTPEVPDTTRPVATPAEPDGESPANLRKVESRMRAGVKRCYDALRSKNLGRLNELYRPASVSDEDKLRRLTRILRTETWGAVVGRRFDGAREIGVRSAAMEFSVPLTWRDPIGAHRSSQPIFRAEFDLQGREWRMSSCRIVGSPNL